MVSMLVGSKPLDFNKKIYYCEIWKWLGPGGPPGLQIQWRAEMSVVGSIPMHFRHIVTNYGFLGQGEEVS